MKRRKQMVSMDVCLVNLVRTVGGIQTYRTWGNSKKELRFEIVLQDSDEID